MASSTSLPRGHSIYCIQIHSIETLGPSPRSMGNIFLDMASEGQQPRYDPETFEFTFPLLHHDSNLLL